MQNRSELYWPGLDTVRIIAAVAVVLYHARWLFPAGFPLPSGLNAVRLFFALSGFLITLLLMREREKYGRIDVRAFYIRRALRIMPLYFLILAVCVAIPLLRPAPDIIAAASLFMLPLVPNTTFKGGLAHLWSIGVEEAYYLFYPALIARFGIVRVCIGLILLRAALDVGFGGGFIAEYRFDAMAIGGLIAWIIRERRGMAAVLLSTPVAWASAIVSACLLFSFDPISDGVLAVVFSVFIANVAFNPRFSGFHWGWTSWLGQRSYGVYMWHYPVNILALLVIIDIPKGFLLFLIFAITLVLTIFSYRYFEHPFLTLKARFVRLSPVKSSPVPERA